MKNANYEASHCTLFIQSPLTSFLLGSRVSPQHSVLTRSQSVLFSYKITGGTYYWKRGELNL